MRIPDLEARNTFARQFIPAPPSDLDLVPAKEVRERHEELQYQRAFAERQAQNKARMGGKVPFKVIP